MQNFEFFLTLNLEVLYFLKFVTCKLETPWPNWKFKVSTWITCNDWLVDQHKLQLNEHQTAPYFLQNFQSNTTDFLIIHLFVRLGNLKLFWQFCKSQQKQFHVCKPYKCKALLSHSFGDCEENIDLSHICLVVSWEVMWQAHTLQEV